MPRGTSKTPLEIWTPTDASEYLRVSVATIQRAAKSGDIPAFRFRGQWRFDAKAVREWATRSRSQQNRPSA